MSRWNIVAAATEAYENRHICSMCQNIECTKAEKREFCRNFKTRTCPRFVFQRIKSTDYISSWEKLHADDPKNKSDAGYAEEVDR